MSLKTLTRRDFLAAAAAAPLAGALRGRRLKTGGRIPSEKSRVVLIRDEKALRAFKQPDARVVRNMLDQAVSVLLDEKHPASAWKRLISPEDTVGIKSNVYRYLPTTPEIEQAIAARVREAGVPEARISIDDRGVRRNPVFREATVLINARPARTHHWSGMGSLIKNYIMFVPRPSAYHGDSCADLGSIWNEYGLLDKTRLNVLVMLFPQFHTVGPHSYSDKYVWGYKGLIVSRDPVAADSVGLRILTAKRREFFGEDVSLRTPAKHIRAAETRHGLGVADPSRIELITLGWKKGLLLA